MAEEYYNPPPPLPDTPTSNMAVISLIAGITGWSVLPIIGSIVAIITGHMAKNEIRDSMGRLGGNGLATAGLVLGYASLALGVLGICAVIALGVSIPLCFIPWGNIQF